MKTSRLICFILTYFLLSPALGGQDYSLLAQQKADIVYTNGKIWTVDKQKPTARAVAVLNEKILAVGSNQEIRQYVDAATTKVIDLQGKFMMPGFIDNHTHFLDGVFQLQSIDLRNAKNETEFSQIVKDYVEKHPNQWITGGNWDHDNFPTGELPGKELVDVFTEQQGFFVVRYDGHMGLANSYTLALAGITRDTPNPPGGEIEHDKLDGEPTGILKDEAMSLVYKLIPPATQNENLQSARLALAEARKLGLTSIQDVSYDAALKTYQTLKAKGELTARMYCRMPISGYQNLVNLGIQVPFGDEWIRVGSLKAFADGSLGSTTAWFSEPYVSDPNTTGLASDIVLDGRLEKWALDADKNKLQLSVHAIGDKANGWVLDLYRKIVETNPRWERRFRIEHAQHIAPEDFSRLYGLDVNVSVQPYHAIDDGRWAEKRIGHERCKTTYPFRTFLDKGIRMCFGSDWTVAPLNPLLGIYAAVTRRTLDGKNPDGWFPEQKITIKEAIEAYTINNAYAAFEENEKGSISVGKLADFVVLSQDLITIDPTQIENIIVEMTIVGGKVVYQKQ
ncbi:MAG: amidohydrolase family protein [Ignavibacteriae bacterium]|nr:amidohydrolase family protein [Ignavibacteriota bacterium]